MKIDILCRCVEREKKKEENSKCVDCVFQRFHAEFSSFFPSYSDLTMICKIYSGQMA